MRRFVLIALLLLPVVPLAGEDDTADLSLVFPDGRHLVEFGWTQLDSFDGDTDILLPSYSYSWNRQLRFSVTGSVLDLSIPADDSLGIPEGIEETGLGDTLVSLQFDPGANLTSAPWVPNTVGLYTALQIPTGDEKKSLSGDSWVAEIGAGWLVDMPRNFWLIPNISYAGSFNHGSDEAYRIRQGGVSMGLYWLFPSATWIGVEPYLGWDFDRDRDHDVLKVVIGQAFPNGMSVYLEYGTQDRGERDIASDDEVLLINFAWQFGDPPREP